MNCRNTRNVGKILSTTTKMTSKVGRVYIIIVSYCCLFCFLKADQAYNSFARPGQKLNF